MRGAPLNSALVHILSRIIPADAGSTYGSTSIPLGSGDHPRGCGEHIPGRRLVQLIGDHPRGCGEHICLALLLTDLLGSSPRMRGAPPVLLGVLVPHGIIPADAGSTTYIWIGGLMSKGSSPRMRGARK